MPERTFSHKISEKDRIAILGASRGLGFALYQELSQRHFNCSFFVSSRKITERASDFSEKTHVQSQDYSKTPVTEEFLNSLCEFAPTRLIYVAGGGPHGSFHSKKWSDHQWALNTSFLYPAELLHRILSQNKSWPGLTQIVLVGSEIAEAKPDLGAASYAAAKHGLRGLVTSIQAEQGLGPEVLLFSPGYMQTDLLPAESWPVQKGLAVQPSQVAKELIAFIEKNNQR
ncbi:MAG: hypothetical protein A2622_06700 [Bdellovibrionales bacterium RIFCSPHIGHO2_01_FULL_40_29]|nr:MAG: hypothetical protein A2622_06700 [Bdellovibrionales bacterium RIFCSPHIGHO2_01_FULL_40_29]OFZ35129.1 MAG: hypothetical protein A3D17_07050 [Bdellovibrionales bacterium RIFCSPHIGHO2_02_FULL_40_15]